MPPPTEENVELEGGVKLEDDAELEDSVGTEDDAESEDDTLSEDEAESGDDVDEDPAGGEPETESDETASDENENAPDEESVIVEIRARHGEEAAALAESFLGRRNQKAPQMTKALLEQIAHPEKKVSLIRAQYGLTTLQMTQARTRLKADTTYTSLHKLLPRVRKEPTVRSVATTNPSPPPVVPSMTAPAPPTPPTPPAPVMPPTPVAPPTPPPKEPTVLPMLPTVETDSPSQQRIMQLVKDNEEKRVQLGGEAQGDVIAAFSRLLSGSDWANDEKRQIMKSKSGHLVRARCKDLFEGLYQLLDAMIVADLPDDWWTLASIRALFAVSAKVARQVQERRPTVNG